MIKDNHRKYIQLRKKHKHITFESFKCSVNEGELKAEYLFVMGKELSFRPTFFIPLKKDLHTRIQSDKLENLIFHIGMVELISYWKAACPPEIIIKPFKLDSHQVQFWKKLYFNGMGEFFYMNGIRTTMDEFVTITSPSQNELKPLIPLEFGSDKVLVPVGGGKDSIVTLELLKTHFRVIPFVVNLLQASLTTIEIAGFPRNEVFEVQRTIDPLLLDLNSKGYLNGHTPFSALLAFFSLLASAMTGTKHIALSNESSANEPTVAGGANHQYSKSVEFEADFRKYCKKYISDKFNYFSFLRPLNEYRIASLFSRYPVYFKVFRSCNVGSKEGIWCGQCPKCLFAFIILSPFMPPEEMQHIFGYNLFTNENLQKILDELTGITSVKPFECVGTTDEVNVALQEAAKYYGDKLPALLAYYQALKNVSIPAISSHSVRTAFDNHHFLKQPFLDILKSALHD